jgi:hypothetical protein
VPRFGGVFRGRGGPHPAQCRTTTVAYQRPFLSHLGHFALGHIDGDAVPLRPLTKSAFSAESPDMEGHPDDQSQQDDRGGNLNPDHAAQLSQHDLQPRTPWLWNLISEGLDRMGHEPQRIPDPARFVDEGGEISAQVASIVRKRNVCALLVGRRWGGYALGWVALKLFKII